MFLNKRQIDKNIKWLLLYGSPPVKYLTHRYLLNTNSSSGNMKILWRKVENEIEVRNLFSKQKPNGSWGGGSYKIKTAKESYTPFTPKYITTVWILPILGEMGFDVKDERIKRACEYVMRYRCSDGMFYRNKPKQPANDITRTNEPTHPCDLSVYLTSLGSVGMSEDRRLVDSYNNLLKMQRDDGGWVSEFHRQKFNWTRSCPWVSHFGASALYYSRNSMHKQPLIKALKFLAWHFSIRQKDEIRRLFYHGHNAVKELLMFSEGGINMSQKPLQTLLEWLLTMYNHEEGFFEYRGKVISKFSQREDGATARVIKYRLHHLIETDWFTYYMTRIAKGS